jgi:precorrin-6B methylase 1
MTMLPIPEVFIAGCGPGSRDYVTPRVTDLAMKAQLLGGTPRLLALFPESKARRMPQNGSIEPWLDRLEATPARPCVILVAGDPGEDHLTKQLIARFGRERCCIEPGISSTRLACNTLGLNWQDVAQFDLQDELPTGMCQDVAAQVSCLFVMGAVGAEALVAALAERQQRQCLLIEDLSLPTQSVIQVATQELAQLPPRAGRMVVARPCSAPS